MTELAAVLRRGSAAVLHRDEWPESPTPRLVRCEVDAPALVLGSTQPDGIVDERARAGLGVAVARRRSGGGAVLLVPGDHLWVDVYLPRSDPRWDDRVDRSFDVIGDAWATALASCGVPDTRAHRGPLEADELGRLVCFGGIGPGEVLVPGDGSSGGAPRKAVGLSQRRTRWGARIQCLVHHRFDAGSHRSLLGLDGASADTLGRRVAVVEAEPAALVGAFASALRRAR